MNAVGLGRQVPRRPGQTPRVSRAPAWP